MYKIAHLLIITVYLLCPVVAIARGIILYAKRGKRRPLRRIRLTALLGMSVGVLVCILYAASLHGRLRFTQVLLTGYLATSLLMLLQGFDQLLWTASRRIFFLDYNEGAAWKYTIRVIAGFLARASIVFCIGLPYVLSAVTTYRPKTESLDTPKSLFQWSFAPVEFPATDGARIAGWWIPSTTGETDRTVLVCPGQNADKGYQLLIARRLVPNGYNVLVFDFRAHGESSGQLCSFGDLERRDVLGAMRWLHANHPAACRAVGGVGVSTGGAALLAAAADASPEGQGIDAVAVCGSFDRADNAFKSLTRQFVPNPLRWFVDRLSLPMAGMQVGSDLPRFAPAIDIKQIWPRPVLVIHGMDDEFVPFESGQSLFDSALQPKANLWLTRTGHDQSLRSDSTAKLVRRFFDSARRVI